MVRHLRLLRTIVRSTKPTADFDLTCAVTWTHGNGLASDGDPQLRRARHGHQLFIFDGLPMIRSGHVATAEFGRSKA